MSWLYAVLLVLSPAILYGTALIVTVIVTTYYRRQCSECGKRGLKNVNFIMATIVVNGVRIPDSWSYYVCEQCPACFKLHRGALSRVTLSEVQQYRGGIA